MLHYHIHGYMSLYYNYKLFYHIIMDNSLLTVYKCPFSKIRIGKPNDGGYVLADIPNIQYDMLLSCGIDKDISFELNFVNKYDCECLAYDGTINSISIDDPSIKFIKKNIGSNNNDVTTNLHTEINEYQCICIKMDIEGWEYQWIESLPYILLNKIDQIIIEFHHPIAYRKHEIFKFLNNTHYLIHFHANNCCGVVNNNGVDIPNVFECTYLHKKYIISPELNTDIIPGPLDMNNIDGDDIFIDYPPFVN